MKMENDNEELKVIFPNEVLNGKKMESVFISPVNNKIGLAILSGKFKCMHLLRLYQISMDKDENFIPTHEIAAFTFHTRQQLLEFIYNIPAMSALELLMLMNSNSV